MAHPLTVPVGATAVRPTWAELPSDVRELVEERLGGRVVSAVSQGSGYTPGFASRLTLANGSRVFVKAADDATRMLFAASYREEIRKLHQLPTAVPAPRLQWWHDEGGWVVLCLDDVTGRAPHRPWRTSELRSVVAAVTAMSQALTPAPQALTLPTWRDELDDVPSYCDRCEPDGLVAQHGEQLVQLAQAGLDVGGDTLVHCDLRDDNIIVDGTGRVWVCDWNWPVLGAPWIDLLTVLISARGDGHDADAILAAGPLTQGVSAENIDAVLALLAVYFLGAKEEPAPPTSPWLRVHQTWYADVTWAWLADRRGWR